MQQLLPQLDAALGQHQPKLAAMLQPGISISRYRGGNLRTWFGWKNGQPNNFQEVLHGRYYFVNFEDATAQLHHMRSSLWLSPVQALMLAVFARRSFYSLPLVIDAAGDGYYYHLNRRTVFWKFEGESDILFPRFESFVELLTELVSINPTPHDACGAKEWELLQRFGTAR